MLIRRKLSSRLYNSSLVFVIYQQHLKNDPIFFSVFCLPNNYFPITCIPSERDDDEALTEPVEMKMRKTENN